MAFALAWRARPAVVVGLAVLNVSAGTLPGLATWLTGQLFDALAAGAQAAAGTLAALVAGLAVAALLARLLPTLANVAAHELEREVGLRMQGDVMAHLNSIPSLAPFEDPAVHDRTQMMQIGAETAPSRLVQIALSMVQQLLTAAGVLAVLVSVSPLVALLVSIAAIPAVIAELRLSRRRVEVTFSLAPAMRRRTFFLRLISDVRSAKEIRLFGLGRHFEERMRHEYRTINRAQRRLDLDALRIHLLLGGLAAAIMAVALVLSVRQVVAGDEGIGALAIFLGALTAMQAASAAIVSEIGGIGEEVLMFDHCRYLRELPPHVESRPASVNGGGRRAARAGIEFHDVWFRYSPAHPWVLRGVDLAVPPGTTVALVGVNGTGKTTLVKLLCRLYEPGRGAITWDGVDIRELPLDRLRGRISAVFQDFMEYDLTAAENIGLGAVEHLDDRDRIRRAAEEADVHADLMRLPQGYDTLLSRIFAGADSQAGVQLSGGQWQRVALARGFIRHPEVVILDEPSASLDADAEYALHTRFAELKDGRTALLISHRFSTVKMADSIAVLEAGRVSELGTHAQLVAAGGTYARLYARQAASYRA